MLVDYLGFEPVQRLIAACATVVSGAPIDPSLAAKIVHLRASDGPEFKAPVDAQWLDDAVDEAVFVDQRQVEEGEFPRPDHAGHVSLSVSLRTRSWWGAMESARASLKSSGPHVLDVMEIEPVPPRDRIEAEILKTGNPGRDLERRIDALGTARMRLARNATTNTTRGVTGHRR